MNAVVRIALRDLRRGYRGFWIFFGCLALGVAAITTVTVLSDSLLSGIEKDGKRILGGDLAVQQQFRPVTEEQFEALTSYASEWTEFIELSTLLRTENATNSVLVSLKAVAATYPLHGEVKLHSDQTLATSIARRDGAWGALVDASIIESGRAKVGDLVDFGANRFRVTGVIADEPDRVASTGRFAFWPRVMVHRDSLENSGLLGFGSRSNSAVSESSDARLSQCIAQPFGNYQAYRCVVVAGGIDDFARWRSWRQQCGARVYGYPASNHRNPQMHRCLAGFCISSLSIPDHLVMCNRRIAWYWCRCGNISVGFGSG